MKRVFSSITRRVLLALLVLAAGVATNMWHKNVVSGLAISITAIALAVWLGSELSKGNSANHHR